VTVGLAPVIDRGKIRFVGNAALDGATEALLSKKKWDEGKEIADDVVYIELSTEPEFVNMFAEGMKFQAGMDK